MAMKKKRKEKQNKIQKGACRLLTSALQDFNSLSDTHFSIVTPALNLKVGAQVVVFGIPFK